MLMFLLFTTLAAVVLAQLEPQPRYREDSVEGRVVGGHVPHHAAWPYQVSIQFYSGSSYHHFCGGTLIRRGWVMTAAHCVNSPRTLRVVLGQDDLNDHHAAQIKSIIHVYIHHNWNNNSISSGNDIALLRLSSDASLNSHVQLGSLPPFEQILPHNSHCYITGWGRISTGGSMSVQLRQAYLPLVDYNTCTSSGWWGSTVTTNMVCAGGGFESGCNGDFGGPLSCLVNGKYYVHGIASFVSGMGCNTPKKPTVFTRVSAYINWMDSVMNKA